MDVRYYQGTGRRKTSVARVRVYPDGQGEVMINGRTLREHFGARVLYEKMVLDPLRLVNMDKTLNVTALVRGGGDTGQAGAVRFGLARALVQMDANLRPVLKKAGMLTRDPRVKERKKPGLKRARKRPTYTKR
jgi:small subunit ribosomal protein S9